MGEDTERSKKTYEKVWKTSDISKLMFDEHEFSHNKFRIIDGYTIVAPIYNPNQKKEDSEEK